MKRLTRDTLSLKDAWDSIEAVKLLGHEMSAIWAKGRWRVDEDGTELFGPFEVTLLKRPGGSFPVLFEDTVAKKTVRVSPDPGGWLSLDYYVDTGDER